VLGMVVAADTDLEAPPSRPAGSRSDDDEVTTRSDPSRTRAIVAIVATIAAITPFLFVIAIRAGHAYHLTQDLAVIDVRARDLFTAHPPLTGPWSRAGFAHPGPLYYWALGILAGITANASWSILVGGAVVRIVGMIATARLAWIRGGLSLCLLVVGATMAAQVALSPGALVSPWNIFAALAFFPVFLLLAWSVVLGEVRRLPWLAVVGTFLVQTHIGYGLLLLAPSVWVVAHLVRDRQRSDAALRRSIVWSVLWLVLLWLPVLIDQLFVTGNLGAVSDYVLNTHDPKAGFGRSIEWFAEQFELVPVWAGGPVRVDSVSGFATGASPAWLVTPVALLVLAGWATRRRGSRDRRTFFTLVLITTASAVVAMAAVTGDQFDYLIQWRSLTALLILVAAAWSLVPWIRSARARWITVAVATAGILATSVFLTARVVDLPTELRPDDYRIGAIGQQLADRAPRSDRFLVRGIGEQRLGLVQTVVDALDRRGAPVRVDPHLDYEFGPQRILRAADAATIWLVAEKGWLGSRMRTLPGARIVYSSTGLSKAEERELERGQLTLLRQLKAAKKGTLANSLDNPLIALLVAKIHRVDQNLARRVATLDERSQRTALCRCVVVAFDHPDARTRAAVARFSNAN
jgi:hypothetical protein